MSTILVPVDFSDETPEVIECAAMVARRNRSDLVLMHVATIGERGESAALEEDIAGKLDRLERYLREEGFNVSSTVRAGEPAREIVELGGNIHADCIIMGRHDHGDRGFAVKSPVTSSVEKAAPCTVIAVP